MLNKIKGLFVSLYKKVKTFFVKATEELQAIDGKVVDAKGPINWVKVGTTAAGITYLVCGAIIVTAQHGILLAIAWVAYLIVISVVCVTIWNSLLNIA